MQSRRDHVQAYRFATNRLTSALVLGSTGRGLAPFRRASLGAFLGIILAALLCGGSVVYGIINPASAATTWQQPGAIVVDAQTGTRFIYLDGELHPTLNYTSALLVAGQNATVHSVPEKSLAHTRVGSTIGITGAPQLLPAATAMLPATWAVCLAPGTSSGVVLDLAPGRHATGATTGKLILVTAPAGPEYVLYDGRKYPVAERGALVAFGLGDQQAIPAPAAWLADLPTGAPLAAPAIAGAGRAGPAVGGRPMPIGTVFETAAAGADQYYVLLASGLAPASRTEAALLTTSGHSGPVQQVSPAVIAAAVASPDRSLLGGLPDLLAGAAYQPAGTAVCARQTSPGTSTSSTTVITDQAAADASAGVILPPGTGMIVQLPPQSGFTSGPSYLITSTGTKYALADTDATSALGYSDVTPQTMPASVLALIPSGPGLSVNAARQAVTQP
jgi:type VII secretion protein EccB